MRALFMTGWWVRRSQKDICRNLGLIAEDCRFKTFANSEEVTGGVVPDPRERAVWKGPL